MNFGSIEGSDLGHLLYRAYRMGMKARGHDDMTTTNVVVLPVETTLDIPANRVLNSAITEPPLDAVLVIGKKDGKFYLASNTGKLAEILLLLRRAELSINQRVFESLENKSD